MKKYVFAFSVFIIKITDIKMLESNKTSLKKNLKYMIDREDSDKEQNIIKTTYKDNPDEISVSSADEDSFKNDDVNSKIFGKIDKPKNLTNLQKEGNKKLKTKELKDKIKNVQSELNKHLGLNDNDITAVNDKRMWNTLSDRIKAHKEEYFDMREFSISFQARYFLCFYIFIYIPGEIGFFIPHFLLNLIPDEITTKELKFLDDADALHSFKAFFEFIRDQADKQFLLSFTASKSNSDLLDLDFLITIPFKIFSDPLSILERIYHFDLTCKGYKEFKENKMMELKKNKKN